MERCTPGFVFHGRFHSGIAGPEQTNSTESNERVPAARNTHTRKESKPIQHRLGGMDALD